MNVYDKIFNILESIFPNNIEENFKFYIKGKKGEIQLPLCVSLEKIDHSMIDNFEVTEDRVILRVSS